MSIEDKSKFPFLSLRLPDVLGPYDDSGRFWVYVLWMRMFPDDPIEMVSSLSFHSPNQEEDDVNDEMSFVYSCDVADFILLLLHKLEQGKLDKKLLNQAYNLACEETINLPKFLKIIVSSSSFLIIKG